VLPILIDEREHLLLELTQTPTASQIGEVVSLWDQFSGMPGMLHANRYRFERGKFYNRTSGKELDPNILRAGVDKISQQVSLEMRKKTQQLIAGTVIFAVWYRSVRNMMRVLYRTVWLLSIGGLLFDDDLERNAFYLFVISQFNFFENLAFRIYVNDLPRNGQLLNYVGQYGIYGRSMWENLKLRTASQYGQALGRRVLGYNDNHCISKKTSPGQDRPGCVELARQGWIPAQDIVPIGMTICGNQCHCHIEVE
jgi:hypothetical protein